LLSQNPTISQIILYPIKALDGIGVSSAKITAGGSLEHDRAYAILDERGKQVRGKSNKKVHLLRPTYDLDAQTVKLAVHGTDETATFHLLSEERKLEAWLSDFFGFRVYLIHNGRGGYPDDRLAWGPTIVSEASFDTVAGWFPALTPDRVRRRFRPNIIIKNVPAFWEDRLFGEPRTYRQFQTGAVNCEGANPCARCVVPTRDPDTSDEYERFQKTFAERRKETLPSWSAASRFDHFYRFCVNTRIHPTETGKTLQVGDEVRHD
jgi:hypothetical protein